MAIHLLVITYSCGHVPAVVTSLELNAGAGSQLSVAVAFPVKAGPVPDVQSISVSAGQTITGLMVSLTMIVWKQVSRLRQASVATHILVMIYSCGQLPAVVTSLELTTGAGSQLSVAMADPVNAGVVPDVQSIMVSAGHVMIGLIVS